MKGLALSCGHCSNGLGLRAPQDVRIHLQHWHPHAAIGTWVQLNAHSLAANLEVLVDGVLEE
eukprot:CAMPEP_0172678144 /NCGR_PEP_ID=MMETSP1074-20121228/15171_1 /TAXON_ID=2916 /ORGANISM="Ceratium fusus, Strain PA161109" /LENGTH=61 /DNA_ID=CAMNT_0013496101 /DNA_START=379 /DNA_END=561 /DNA_ORIENTATION=+